MVRGFYYSVVVLVAVFACVTAIPSYASEWTDDAGTIGIQGSSQRARIVGVVGSNAAAGTLDTVIDARDRFGNKVRRIKTARLNPLRIKNFLGFCRNPATCVGAIGISLLLDQLALSVIESIDGNGAVHYQVGQATSIAQCQFQTVENPTDPNRVVSSVVQLPCIREDDSSHVAVWAPGQVPEYDAAGVGYQTQEVWYGNPAVRTVIYWYNIQKLNGQPIVNPGTVTAPLSDAALATLAAQNPALVQLSRGLFAPVFDPVAMDDADNLTPDEGADPDYGSGGDGSEPPSSDPEEEMLSMDMVPTEEIDVASYLDWGAKWLPAACPAPLQISVLNHTDQIDLQLACEVITDYVRPFFRIVGLILFFTIVFRGVS